MATVPGNSLQQQLQNQIKIAKRPSYGVRGVRRGTLVKVYDRDTLLEDNIPGELANALSNRPGRLYGQVKLSNSELLYLPFLYSPEIIYSIYGDSQFLEGRTVNIVYYDRNVHLGEIDIIAQENTSLTDTKTTTNIYDIGKIF